MDLAGGRGFNSFLESFNRRKEKNKVEGILLVKPSRELWIEEILRLTFDLYSRNFVTFFIPILVSMLLSGVLVEIILSYVINIPQIPVSASLQEVWSLLFNYFMGILPTLIAFSLLSWIISTITQGVCIKCASDLMEKGSASLEQALNFTFKRLVTLLIAAVIVGVLTLGGLITLIIPGIILAVGFSLVVPAIIIENLGAISSLSRSWGLVSNRWLKTLGLMLIITIITMITSFIAMLIAAPFGSFGWLPRQIISAFVGPIYPIALTVYYYSMLARRQQGSPPPP
jgi:hypothetical protein